jgi:cysteine sulfinate desulfinase/cysteine desulfurase-like protein
MAEAVEYGWGNPASIHATGRRARAIVEDARAAIARLLGRDERDVVFTSGGTEANNLALAGARAVVTSRVEHPSIVRVAEAAEQRGTPVRWVGVGGSAGSSRRSPKSPPSSSGRGRSCTSMRCKPSDGSPLPRGTGVRR